MGVLPLDTYRGIAEGKAEGIQEGIEKGKAEGIQEGIEKGKAEGIQEGIEQIAKKMLTKGTSIQEVSDTTGLSIAKITQLANSLPGLPYCIIINCAGNADTTTLHKLDTPYVTY